jgi:hypothetical protein
MSKVRVRITNNNFGYGLKTVKRLGGIYEPATKTWLVPADKGELNAPGNYSLAIVSDAAVPRPNPATTWMGPASMDAAESIF